MKRVVITGMGAISGNGSSVSEVWDSLASGEARRRTVDGYFDIHANERAYSTKEGLISTVCGSTFTSAEMGEKLGLKGKRHERFERHQLFALLAAEEAMQDAGLNDHTFNGRFGCVCGTGDGGLHETYMATLELLNGRGLSPFSNLRQLPNVFSGYLAQRFRLRGPNHVHCTACAASAHAMQHACDLIKLDRADIVMTGGTEAVITPFGISSFCSQRALSNHSKPYQKDRLGFLMGEGAGIVIVEEREHALRRGANIYAEIVGYGASADGDPESQITDPGKGGIQSACNALAMASLKPEQISYINTHGTATGAGDLAEIQGIKEWAGVYAENIPVSSTKSYTGHLLGAAGALEAILCVKMLNEQTLLPTLGLTEDSLDPECGGVKHVMHKAVPTSCEFVLSNSFGFGGTNATTIYKHH